MNFNKYLLISFGVIAVIIFSLFLLHNPARADITTGLVGWWKFDEGSGTAAADSSGNNNTGTLTNGPTWTTGKIGGALSFDGTNDYVGASVSDSNLATTLTLSQWVKATSFAEFAGIISNFSDGGMKVFINSGVTGGFGVGFRKVGGSYAECFSASTQLGVWYHLTVTYNTGAVNIYINGNLDKTCNGNTTITNNSTFYIGYNNNNDAYFKGLIDEVRIYNRALSASEVSELFNYTGGGTPTPTPTPSGTPTPTPTPPPDTTPPTISNGSPTGTLSAGTTQTTISLTTNENATCKYSTTANTTYASMSNTFSTTGATNHSTMVSGLSNGNSYTYYVRCQDTAGNANTSDYTITFSVASSGGAGNIYWVSPTGSAVWANCSGSAPLSGTLACSLTTANSTASAGDTVYVRAGTYNISGSGINPSHSGTPGNVITFSAYNSESVQFVGAGSYSTGVDLASSQSYIKVNGITFTNFYHPLQIHSGSHNEISYCTFSGQYNAATSDWVGSRVRSGAMYNHIHHCSFSDYGMHNGDDLDVLFGIGIEESTSDGTKYNLIEYNTFAHGGHHVVEVNGSQNVFRYNYVHNEPSFLYNGTLYGNRVLFFAGEPPDVGRNLIEGNRVAYGGETSEPDQCGGSGGTIAAQYNIFRRNMFYKCLLYGLYITTYSGSPRGANNYIYDNTFWNNGITTTCQPKSPYGGYLTHGIVINEVGGTNTKNNIIKNNLFWQNIDALNATRPVINENGAVPVYNTVINNFNQTSDPLFVNISGTPDPTNETQFNFNLQSGSPAIDAAGFLTTITSVSGSGTSFAVADANYFFDGWGMSAITSASITGDTIQLAGQTQRAKITNVNYSTNTITVDTSLTWTNGQGITLAYEGSAPDIGAYEYVSGGDTTPPTPPTNVQVN